jgi:hypothetical protein
VCVALARAQYYSLYRYIYIIDKPLLAAGY